MKARPREACGDHLILTSVWRLKSNDSGDGRIRYEQISQIHNTVEFKEPHTFWFCISIHLLSIIS